MAKGNSEYVAAGYILAAPIIFEKFQHSWKEFDIPIMWIYNWEMKNNPNFIYAESMTEEERSEIHIDYDLTHSMVELGRLALHLWNNTPFSLLDCLTSLDKENFDLAMNAIFIRTKQFQKIFI